MKIYLIPLFLILASCSNNESNNKKPEEVKQEITNDSTQQQLVESIPEIDGVINNSEWSSSLKYELLGGDSVFFQKTNDRLFVAIRGNSGGFTSLGIASNNYLKIYHASTGLITAAYKKVNDAWQLDYDFKEPLKSSGEKYPRDGERLTDAYKQAQLQQFGWYANLIEMGKASETEFEIPFEAMPDSALYFSVVFYQVKSQVKMAKFPAILDDGMLHMELVAGTAKNGLDFNLGNWKLLSELE